jgi:hypothetical protein
VTLRLFEPRYAPVVRKMSELDQRNDPDPRSAERSGWKSGALLALYIAAIGIAMAGWLYFIVRLVWGLVAIAFS